MCSTARNPAELMYTISAESIITSCSLVAMAISAWL